MINMKWSVKILNKTNYEIEDIKINNKSSYLLTFIKIINKH